ncbi:PAC2 family protein [Dehalococcoides mccartyi]|uniref:PAC2 family protein n=1 Tax=Dehalococcoides mccartyi TaxID=61435 RepID=UPI003390F641
MDKKYKLNSRPKLKSPCLLAAWPGISNVALIVATYLARKLEFKELAEIDSPSFFDPIGVLVKDGVVEEPQFPQNRFYYLKNKQDNDIILFIGEDQPSAKSYELANLILDVGQRFGVKKIYTFAAALTRIHHSEQPRAWAVGTNPQVANELVERGLSGSCNLQISGLNGLLLGVAKERNIDGVCLLGEVPSYASRLQNPMAALVIVQILSKLLQLEVDISELEQIASEAKQHVSQIAAEAMEDYIDYFTEPIWESGEDDDDDLDNDDDDDNEEASNN